MLLSDRDNLAQIDAERVRLDPWDPTLVQPSSVQVTYDYLVHTVGKKRADQTAAKPDHSEQQLGLAVDAAGTPCGNLYDSIADTPTGKWGSAKAHRYGFIIRYPEGGTGVTDSAYGSRRFVGPRAAWMMHVCDEIYWDAYQPVAVSDSRFDEGK